MVYLKLKINIGGVIRKKNYIVHAGRVNFFQCSQNSISIQDHPAEIFSVNKLYNIHIMYTI